MQTAQHIFTDGDWRACGGAELPAAQLALVFGATAVLDDPDAWRRLRARYPQARLVGCSTAGEIADVEVLDERAVVTAVALDRSRVEVAHVELGATVDSGAVGAALAAQLPHAELRHVLVISEGLAVNGSALVAGLTRGLPGAVRVSGGLSGDGARFGRTGVYLDGPTPSRQIVAIGLYGPDLHVGCGSRGGWDPFGPERHVTRADGNVLFELDGEPALDLYKRYLGEHAAGLPATGLSFPLAVRTDTGEPVVRTILAVDEAARSLTFAGDVPVGARARLMRASIDRLVGGAADAAQVSVADNAAPDLAILISCVGRKLVMRQRVVEELEAVRAACGPRTALTGFYSYGEISPFSATSPCALHNQTMTVTTISER